MRMPLTVMNKSNSYPEHPTFTTDLVWYHWFIFYLQEWIYVLHCTSWQSFHQILVKYILRVCYTCWYILKKTWIWALDIMPIWRVHLYLPFWHRLELRPRTNWWCSITPASRTLQILVEVQAHIFFYYQGGPTDHCTHVPGPVAQPSAESEYKSGFTVGMAISQWSILTNWLLNKYTDVVPEQAHIIILDGK